MSFQQWDTTNEPIRPGLYINFKKAAEGQISGGERGTVAIPLMNYDGEAEERKFYTVDTESEAIKLFNIDNIQSIKFALQGGAKNVLVYTMPEEPMEEDYIEMRDKFEARPFNVFVFDGETDSAEQTNTLDWLEGCREEKKHFFFVTGGSAEDDEDIEEGNSRSTKLEDDYVINLVNGVVIEDKEYSSGEYAAYIAGLVAGTPINQSITYTTVRVDDVTKRLKNSEIEGALKKGSLVLMHDGEKVKVEQGVTTSGDKIRKVSGRQAISTDIERTARESYIGKLDNNEAGQMTLISAIKSYLERLETENVLTDQIVDLDPQRESIGDKVYLVISYTEIDSMERIFLTINV